MKRYTEPKILKKILIMFMMLQPVLDIYYLYTDEIINIFKFSPATIIRTIMIAGLFLMSYLSFKHKDKFKYTVILSIIYILYTFFHLYNVSLFTVAFESFQNYSHLRELYYLIRMLFPLLIVFITYEKKIEFKDIKKIIMGIYLIFSIVIVVSNILEFSLTSYASGNNIISANFISWFTGGYELYGYEMLASKGMFHMANQVSGLMCSMFPILIYIYFHDKFKLINLVTITLSMFAMLMLGTRIAATGMLLVTIALMFMYLFFVFVKKELVINHISIIALIFITGIAIVIYPYAPVSNRTYMTDIAKEVEKAVSSNEGTKKLENLYEQIKELENNGSSSDVIYDLKINFISENYEIYGFDKSYITGIYHYKIDPDFWLELFDVPFTERADFRQLTTFITKRIVDLNDNPLDYLFGITFTRMRGALIYMENDIYVHMYTIGILGIILFIFPYLFIVIYACYKMFKKKKYFNYLNITYIISILLVYVIGYLTGNIFDELTVTLFLSLMAGALLYRLHDKKEPKKIKK